MAWRLSTPLPAPEKTLHSHRRQIVWMDSFKAPCHSLEDCTEESGQKADSDRVMFLAKMGRLGSPHCMSSAKEASSVGGLVLCLPQSK